MTKRYPPGQYNAMMSRAARKSRGSTSAKRKAALARVTEDTRENASMYDAELEEAIAEVGRDRVFALARAHGWAPPNSPPKYVWWMLVRQAQERKNPAGTHTSGALREDAQEADLEGMGLMRRQ